MNAPLTTEQTTALATFAKSKGRTWKSSLRAAWTKASLTGHLHALRNTHGNAWLKTYRLPK